MNLVDYRSALQQYIFEEYIDIPLNFEFMVDIIATQFFENNVPFKYACSFAKLIIDINNKCEFDFSMIYHPFNILDEENIDENWTYNFVPNIKYESFEIILDGEKRIDIYYQDNLNFESFLNKIRSQDLPLN